jgi:hypothetical protein
VNAAGNVAIIAMPDERVPAMPWNQTTTESGNPDPTQTEKTLHADSA